MCWCNQVKVYFAHIRMYNTYILLTIIFSIFPSFFSSVALLRIAELCNVRLSVTVIGKSD